MIAARDLTGRPLAIVLAAAGAIATSLFIAHVGAAQVAGALASTLPALPLVVALEGARIALEAYGTRRLYPDVSIARLLRVQLVAYGAMLVLPAGRTAACAIKGASLARDRSAAWSAAATEQAASLFAVATASFVLALFVRGSLALALLAHGAVTLALAVGASLVGRRARSSAHSALAPRVFGTFLASRALQVAEVVALARPLHILLRHLPATFGAFFVGASIGDFVPAQLGVTDAALSLTAPHLGASPQSAAALAVAIHLVQLAWLAAACATWMWARYRPSIATEIPV